MNKSNQDSLWLPVSPASGDHKTEKKKSIVRHSNRIWARAGEFSQYVSYPLLAPAAVGVLNDIINKSILLLGNFDYKRSHRLEQNLRAAAMFSSKPNPNLAPFCS